MQNQQDQEDEDIETGAKVGATAGFLYGIYTGSIPALVAYSKLQLASISAFLSRGLMPTSLVLPVAALIIAGAMLGGTVGYIGYRLFRSEPQVLQQDEGDLPAPRRQRRIPGGV